MTPLDIALGNMDSDQIQLLQRFGAKTGHYIVGSSALIIQRRWKIFKRRISAADWVYRSNLNDGIGYHDGADLKLMTNDAGKDSSPGVEGEKYSFSAVENYECRNDNVGEENSEVIETIVKEHGDLNDSLNRVSNEKEKGRIIEQSFDFERINQFKVSVTERIKSSVS